MTDAIANSATDHFDLRAVQSELAKIWESEEFKVGGGDKVRACAVNFVIPIEPDTFYGWQQSLYELARLVPSRIILVERAADGTQPSIDAFVHAAYSRRKDGPLIGSELVHIKCVTLAMRRVPSICRALAVSDLPLLLISLVDARIGGQVARALFEMSDIVVLDSSTHEAVSDEVFCDGDLLWPRLSAWRSAVANFLHGSPEFNGERVERIELVGRRAAPHLLAGWLAFLFYGKLTRPPDEAPRVELPDGRALQFEFRPGTGSVCGVDAVKLWMTEGHTVEFVATDQNTLHIEAHLGGNPIRSRYPVRRLTFAEEVAHIVHSHGADEVYSRSRHLALAITQATFRS